MATKHISSTKQQEKAQKLTDLVSVGELPKPPKTTQKKINACDRCGADTALRFHRMWHGWECPGCHELKYTVCTTRSSDCHSTFRNVARIAQSPQPAQDGPNSSAAKKREEIYIKAFTALISHVSKKPPTNADIKNYLDWAAQKWHLQRDLSAAMRMMACGGDVTPNKLKTKESKT